MMGLWRCAVTLVTLTMTATADHYGCGPSAALPDLNSSVHDGHDGGHYGCVTPTVFHQPGTFEDTISFWHDLNNQLREHCLSLLSSDQGPCKAHYVYNHGFYHLASHLIESCLFSFLRNTYFLRAKVLYYCSLHTGCPEVEKAHTCSSLCYLADHLNQVCMDKEDSNTSTQCNDIFSDPAGVVQSPGYPCGYPRDPSFCVLRIQGQTQDSTVTLTIDTVNIPCYDSLRIMDGFSLVLARVCGDDSSSSLTFTTVSDTALLVLSIDPDMVTSGQGFSIRYTINM